MPARKMLLASRANPPRLLDVPKFNAKNASFKDFLLHSPLPSPALPSILPRHGKKPPALNTKRALRYLTWLFLITAVFYLLSWSTHRDTEATTDPVYRNANGQAYEIVEESNLPNFASPLAVTDAHGDLRWSIHIPASKGFPLKPSEYEDICVHVDEVAQHVAQQKENVDQLSSLQYYDQDPNYIDVAQAQLDDLIPFDPHFKAGGSVPVCKSSMIYVLDSEDAGLGGSLLGLWLAYGLAQREKRAFFIDDTHFTYGKYTDLFAAPPPPACRPGPPTHRVPCPHVSQHLVVSSSTWKWTFGDAFHQKFSKRQIFDMMRIGYEALFKLLPDDQVYVASRSIELRTAMGQQVLAGMHIRRGDRHPDEFQYAQGYIPPAEYASALKKLIDATTTTFLSATSHSNEKYTFILASDDADMYHDTELDGMTMRAQERISLTSNRQLGEFGGLGWERGFFKDVFWNVGVPEAARRHKNVNSPVPTKDTKYQDSVGDFDPQRDYRMNPMAETIQLRNYIGRAYLLDLAVLAQSDRLVCAVSSRGCQLLGVMMGWDKVEKGYWKNIDEGQTDGWKATL